MPDVQPNLFDGGGRWGQSGPHGCALGKVYPLPSGRWAADVDVWHDDGSNGGRRHGGKRSLVSFVVLCDSEDLAWKRAFRFTRLWCAEGVTPPRARCDVWEAPGAVALAAYRATP